MMKKYKRDPVRMMTVFPRGLLAYMLVIGIFVAYLTGHTAAPGANYRVVFRVAGTAAFMAYGLGQLSNVIWKGQPWDMTLKEIFNGLVFGLLTAGTFGWLWPG